MDLTATRRQKHFLPPSPSRTLPQPPHTHIHTNTCYSSSYVFRYFPCFDEASPGAQPTFPPLSVCVCVCVCLCFEIAAHLERRVPPAVPMATSACALGADRSEPCGVCGIAIGVPVPDAGTTPRAPLRTHIPCFTKLVPYCRQPRHPYLLYVCVCVCVCPRMPCV
jgi:hypothetical protein